MVIRDLYGIRMLPGRPLLGHLKITLPDPSGVQGHVQIAGTGILLIEVIQLRPRLICTPTVEDPSLTDRVLRTCDTIKNINFL